MSLHAATHGHFQNMRTASLVTYIATVGLSIIGCRASARTHLVETKGHSSPLSDADGEEYLIIQNARRFCDGANILEADCENPLQDALTACTGAEECTFLCHTAKKRYPPRSSSVPEELESDTAIPKSSASWLCGGSGWMQLYPKHGWVTAIKGSVVRDLCKPFTARLNQTAECSKADTLDVVRDINPGDAVKLCATMAGCSFFTMSLESHESTMAFSTFAHFCRGVPSKQVARDGHLLVTSRAIEEKHRLVPVNNSTTRSRIAYYFGGPLTNDAYYDDKTPGSLVPATRL